MEWFKKKNIAIEMIMIFVVISIISGIISGCNSGSSSTNKVHHEAILNLFLKYDPQDDAEKIAYKIWQGCKESDADTIEIDVFMGDWEDIKGNSYDHIHLGKMLVVKDSTVAAEIKSYKDWSTFKRNGTSEFMDIFFKSVGFITETPHVNSNGNKYRGDLVIPEENNSSFIYIYNM